MRSRCVGLITEDPALYADLAAALRERRIPTVSLWPGERIPDRIAVVLTSPTEASRIEHPRVLAVGPALDRSTLWAAVASGLAGEGSGPSGELLIGIDPGPRPGFAVIHGGRVLVAGVLDVPEAVGPWSEALTARFPGRPLRFRVGCGDPPDRNRILSALAARDRLVEVVDERSTTPRIGRRHRDAMAARAIACKPGRSVNRIPSARPTRGALRDIQRLSREGSGGRFTIPRDTARRVLAGEISLREAIDAGARRRTAPSRPSEAT